MIMAASPSSKLVLLAVILAYTLFGFATLVFGLTPDERQVLREARASLSDLKGKLQSARESNESQLVALRDASQQSASLLAKAKQASERAAQMAGERDSLASELSRFEVKHKDLNAKYQRAQFIIALAAGIIAGLLALQFCHNLQPPYGLVVPIAAGAAAFFGIYMIL
jgi:hypothetical protein